MRSKAVPKVSRQAASVRGSKTASLNCAHGCAAPFTASADERDQHDQAEIGQRVAEREAKAGNDAVLAVAWVMLIRA